MMHETATIRNNTHFLQCFYFFGVKDAGNAIPLKPAELMEQERKPISQIDSGSGGGIFSALDRTAQSRRANKATKARERAKLCLCEDSSCILREKPVRSHVHKKGERASRIGISPFLRQNFDKM